MYLTWASMKENELVWLSWVHFQWRGWESPKECFESSDPFKMPDSFHWVNLNLLWPFKNLHKRPQSHNNTEYLFSGSLSKGHLYIWPHFLYYQPVGEKQEFLGPSQERTAAWGRKFHDISFLLNKMEVLPLENKVYFSSFFLLPDNSGLFRLRMWPDVYQRIKFIVLFKIHLQFLFRGSKM